MESSAGTLVDFASVGSLDQHLTDPVGETLHQHQYKKSTPFAMDWSSSTIENCGFGRKGSVTIQRVADMMGQIFIVADLPGLCVQEEMGGCTGFGQQYPVGCKDSCKDEQSGPCHVVDESRQVDKQHGPWIWAQGGS